MSRTSIILTAVIVDLAIIATVVVCAFQRVPTRQYLFPAIILFSLNGLWLIWMTVKNTPPRQ